MILLIDDIRNLKCADVIARTPEGARNLIMFFHWDIIYFDHDLGEYEDNGYKILTWALETDQFPFKTDIFLVTSNPVGRNKMVAAMKQHGWLFNPKTNRYENPGRY